MLLALTVAFALGVGPSIVPLGAQTAPVRPGQVFGIDATDEQLKTDGVVRIEVQWDGGGWASIGMPAGLTLPTTTAGHRTYPITIPALTPGPHTVSVKFCTAADDCSGGISTKFDLRLVPRDGKNLRPEVLPVGGGSGGNNR